MLGLISQASLFDPFYHDLRYEVFFLAVETDAMSSIPIIFEKTKDLDDVSLVFSSFQPLWWSKN